jgi:hypothetical protein
VNHFVARTVVIALLAAFFAGHAGAVCALSSSASSPMPPCHHRLPASPHPADHQCCVARAPSALPPTVFPLAPTFQGARVDEAVVPVPISNTNISTLEITLPFGPPAAVALRI